MPNPLAMIPFFLKFVPLALKKLGAPEKLVSGYEQFTATLTQAQLAELERDKEITAAIAEADAGQVAQNIESIKADAATGGIYRAGWRPLLGWTCALAVSWHYLLEPVFVYVVAFLGYDVPELPRVNFDDLWTLLFGMLGLSTIRHFDKRKTPKEPSHDSQ